MGPKFISTALIAFLEPILYWRDTLLSLARGGKALILLQIYVTDFVVYPWEALYSKEWTGQGRNLVKGGGSGRREGRVNWH